ncbi:MAG: CvpA family protein [Planctomycetota bacterium]
MALIIQAQAPTGGGGTLLGHWFSGTPWIDIVGLGILLTFLGLGIKHGLVWQVTRLLGMVIAVAIARSAAPDLTPRFQAALELPERACQGIVWVLVFVTCLLIASGIGMIGKRALEAVQLGPMDRAGGALAGAMTGVVVHSALMVLLMSVGSAQWSAHTFEGSRSAVVLDNLARKSNLLLNAQAAERIVGPWGQHYDMQRGREMREQGEIVQRGAAASVR